MTGANSFRSENRNTDAQAKNESAILIDLQLLRYFLYVQKTVFDV